MAAHGDEITMTEAMTEAMMTVTITAGHTEEEVVVVEEAGELFRTGISFTGGGHHLRTTAEGATDPGPDPGPTHLVAIKA